MLDKEFKEKAFKQLERWSIDDLVEPIKLYEKDDIKGFQEKIDKVQNNWHSIKVACSYCQFGEPIIDEDGFRLYIYFNSADNKYYLIDKYIFYSRDVGNVFSTDSEIDYCPKCGRKLGGLNEVKH